MKRFPYMVFSIAVATILLACNTQTTPTHSKASNKISPDSQKVWIYSLEKAMKSSNEVEYLSLREQNLEEFPKEITRLSNLKELDISMNDFHTMHDSIGNLKKLEYLSCSYGKLTSLPASVGRLENLKSLILLDNELTSLPPEIGNLKNLRRLNLALNPIRYQSLPEEFFQLSQLEELAFEDKFHNPIFSEKQRQEIKRRFPNCMIFFGMDED